VPPSGAANVTPTSATTIPAVDVQRIPLNTIDSSKQIAHAALRDAIKELSEGTSRTITLPPVQELNSWKSDDLSALSLEQLELLARAHYEGKGNEFEKNPEEAVRLWREASNRGSLEARYSLAVCHRDGVGVEKNAVEAYGILKELADNKNYNLAHVSSRIAFPTPDRGCIF
jgi:TPR repeat protein